MSTLTMSFRALSWAGFLLLALFTSSSAGAFVCTALPNQQDPNVNDQWCQSTCFANGAPQTAENLAIYCSPLGGSSQTCQCTLAPVDCAGKLGPFGSCSVSCGGGTQTAVFTVTTPAQNGGKVCQYADQAVVVQACNQQSCPSTNFLCLAIPNTGANDAWYSSNCWALGVTDKTLVNAHPGCTAAGGKSQVCICSFINTPSVQCVHLPGMTATDDWCAKSCWIPGTDQTVANLVNYCTAAAGQSQVCACDQVGPSP